MKFNENARRCVYKWKNAVLWHERRRTEPSLNSQSLMAKFTDITLFIDDLLKHNCYIDVIHLQETYIKTSLLSTKLNNIANQTPKHVKFVYQN